MRNKFKAEFKDLESNYVTFNDVSDELFKTLSKSCDKDKNITKFNFDTLICLLFKRVPKSKGDKIKLSIRTSIILALIVAFIVLTILKPKVVICALLTIVGLVVIIGCILLFIIPPC